MSRNLARTDCYYCQGAIRLCEEPRPITKAEARVYFDEHQGMRVANAECSDCEAKYLAWVDGVPNTTRGGWMDRTDKMGLGPVAFVDLSFRSTFNDEPGPSDGPRYRIEVVRVRRPIEETDSPMWPEA